MGSMVETAASQELERIPAPVTPNGGSPCCGPSRPAGATTAPADALPLGETPASEIGSHLAPASVALEGGKFLMGTDDPDGFPDDGESPIHEVELSPFSIEPVAVTNLRFREFVDHTGYVTDAERYGWSFVFGGLLPDEFPDTSGVAEAPWWRQVLGANWRHPEGPQSSIDDRLDHPVVHTSWRDADSFCRWAGLRLPTEAEWEYAARGGLEQQRFPWGEEMEPDGEQAMNVWQGRFPSENTLDDGYLGTCPVDEFRPNAFGLHNVSGNVWEWCADWFDRTAHQHARRQDPTGPRTAQARVIRGGSYLCHHSYCNRYRVGARSSNTPDSSLGNTGFRCACRSRPRDPDPRTR
jgi:formylglycine-generating enzyme required for sulfatase activity